MINRLEPAGPPHAYKTFQIASPIQTHYRDGTCEEAGCLAHRHGWVTTVDESTDHRRCVKSTPYWMTPLCDHTRAYYIRARSGRRFTEAHTETGLTAFTFEAGQRCFTTHKIPLEREEFFVVRDGDWRALGRPRLYDQPDQWVNDFGEHQDRIARVVNG